MIDLSTNECKGNERVIYGLQGVGGEYDFYPTLKEAEWHNRCANNECSIVRIYFNLTREGVCKLLNHFAGSNSELARRETEMW